MEIVYYVRLTPETIQAIYSTGLIIMTVLGVMSGIAIMKTIEAWNEWMKERKLNKNEPVKQPKK